MQPSSTRICIKMTVLKKIAAAGLLGSACAMLIAGNHFNLEADPLSGRVAWKISAVEIP
jgi:hypothetical protein